MNEHEANGHVRQIFWHIRSRRCILASGATERPIAFSNNDRPGIMLAGAVRTYVNRFGASPGKRVAIFTNNDDGWATAKDLSRQGLKSQQSLTPVQMARKYRQPERFVRGGHVVNSKGRLGLSSILINNGTSIPADCLAVSGGWSPNVHLTCHHRGRPIWNDAIAGFVPGHTLPNGMIVTGAASGTMGLASCLKDGIAAGQRAVSDLGENQQKQRHRVPVMKILPFNLSGMSKTALIMHLLIFNMMLALRI